MKDPKPTCREIAEMLRRYSEYVAREAQRQPTVNATKTLEDEADRAAYLAGYLWNKDIAL